MRNVCNHVGAMLIGTLLLGAVRPIPAIAMAPPASAVDYTALRLPPVGESTLHLLSPNLLEVCFINTKAPDPAAVTNWNLVGTNFQFLPPSLSTLAVTADGQPVAIQGLGFKRRPLYAPNARYDLRVENCLYLPLTSAIADGQQVQVVNGDGSLWPANAPITIMADPRRYSPAIHVNQEGYIPWFPKKAMVGYYLGSLGEMPIPTAGGFQLVDAQTGATVYQGNLTARPDVGYNYAPTPYQTVYQADFSSFTAPGTYQLQVPGLGASLPFRIDAGIAMAFARAYALGLYHQRCGTNNSLPYTRFTHDVCHAAAASVPLPQSNFNFTWTTISNYASVPNPENPAQIAPPLTSPSAQLYPCVNTGTLDVSGGHHDAGDYSKYSINSAKLIHTLMFAVDALPGIAAIDNLGLPESGDGISDFMQEAKWEADFLAKMQDADGGFYFLVYPQNREYESNVLPDHGDPQVVWPKNTSITAAAVAALAQCASSPLFKQTYPAAAARYAQKAQLGWNFLTNAIAKYGKAGAYQKITFYSDHFTHDDELAWAACEMFLLTGNPVYQQQLIAWFDPSSPATWFWGWWHACESYGNCIRSFAFAARTGRLPASQLDPTFLAKCQTEIAAAATNNLAWCQDNAYGSSFPLPTKAVQGAGWYFSSDQAFDLTVAYQLNPSAAYLDAVLQNMNYEGGCNPVNVSYIAGLGWKRPRENVSQYAQNDRRVLPPTGLPYGNIQQGFTSLYYYGTELSELCFPQDSGVPGPYPFYDRWGDAFNVTTEYISLNLARSAASLAFVGSLTSSSTQAWQAVPISIVLPTNTALLNTPLTVSVQAPGFDLSTARTVWEARDQEPAFGTNYTFSPISAGTNWVEAEIQWPDGRRLFAAGTFYADGPVDWVDDSVPAGANPGADGGDGWNWVSSNPAPFSGTVAHQSNLAAGEHEHYFTGASATMAVNAGDTLFAYVYLDPANPPAEIMLMWNNGTWEHRAYWGANMITYGADGTAGRYSMGPLPPVGQWVKLSVPASNVGLEGTTVNGMGFTLYGGRATWDQAGKVPAFLTPAGNTVVDWVDDALPGGAISGADGGDGWNWISNNPTPYSRQLAHQSNLAAGLHEHYFNGAGVTLPVATGDVLFSYVYLNPTNPPTEILLSWNDGTSWEHRAYWGANIITYGASGSAGRYYMGPLPAAGQWVQLAVPASAVALPGATLVGMGFTLYDGQATWDYSGKMASANAAVAPPAVMVTANPTNAFRVGLTPGALILQRSGDTTTVLTVTYALGGTASNGVDYAVMPLAATFPAGSNAVVLPVVPLPANSLVDSESVILTLVTNGAYAIGSPATAMVTLAGNSVPILSIRSTTRNVVITWASLPTKTYRVAFRSTTTSPWQDLSGLITATTTTTSYTDTTLYRSTQRYYAVYVTD